MGASVSETNRLSEIEPLTEREDAILRLLTDGLTNREIADRLFLSHETVKWYNKQIYGKLDVNNRTQAAARAHEYGLLNGDGHPPVQPIDGPSSNLPVQVTSFVGRTEDIGELSRLLRSDGVRLITLTGPGGIGKTRLALEVAPGLSKQFADGTTLVDLAPIRQPERVADTIASAIGLEVPVEKSAPEMLARYLQQREILLLIDNFEHVLGASAVLTELLSSAADIKILVTSREPLAIYGETEYPVPPLSLPDLARLDGSSNLSHYESIALFVQRARAARPRFRLSKTNYQPVSEICVRLDGLPLAIELAAARIKHLGPSVLRDQLELTLKPLRAGPRGVPDRQRTLEATVTWSYELLAEVEKALFSGLSVFQGGFTLGAAERVAGVEAPEGIDEGIESLVNKNLVVQRSRSHADNRFGMLQTIHQYARERLAQNGQEKNYRRRHAEYFTDLAEHAASRLRGSEQSYWFGRLDTEYANMRSALAWSFDGADVEMGLRLFAALRDFWYYQGPSIDGLRWIERALLHLGGAPPALRAKAQMSAGHTLLHHGDLERGSALLLEALAIFRELGDPSNTAWTLIFLSYAPVGKQYEYENALTMCNEGLEMFRKLDERAGLAQGLTIIGELARTVGDLDLAERAYLDGLDLARETGDRRRESIQYLNLGMVEQARGEHSRSETLMKDSIGLAREVHFTQVTACGLALLAGPVAGQGNPEKAAAMLGASEALYTMLGIFPQVSDQLEIDRYTAVVRDQLDDEAFEDARQEGLKMSMEQAVKYALEDSSSFD